jgi:hypothetical protein
MRERDHYDVADSLSEMMCFLMEGEYQKEEESDLDSKMRRLKDLSAYSLAHDITYQREGVELLALAKFFGLTSESRFQKNRKRLSLLATETIKYRCQGENIEREIKEQGKTVPRSEQSSLQPRLRGIA